MIVCTNFVLFAQFFDSVSFVLRRYNVSANVCVYDFGFADNLGGEREQILILNLIL